MTILMVLVVRIMMGIMILIGDYDDNAMMVLYMTVLLEYDTCQHIVAFQLTVPRTPGSEKINILELDNMQHHHHFITIITNGDSP